MDVSSVRANPLPLSAVLFGKLLTQAKAHPECEITHIHYIYTHTDLNLGCKIAHKFAKVQSCNVKGTIIEASFASFGFLIFQHTSIHPFSSAHPFWGRGDAQKYKRHFILTACFLKETDLVKNICTQAMCQPANKTNSKAKEKNTLPSFISKLAIP